VQAERASTGERRRGQTRRGPFYSGDRARRSSQGSSIRRARSVRSAVGDHAAASTDGHFSQVADRFASMRARRAAAARAVRSGGTASPRPKYLCLANIASGKESLTSASSIGTLRRCEPSTGRVLPSDRPARRAATSCSRRLSCATNSPFSLVRISASARLTVCFGCFYGFHPGPFVDASCASHSQADRGLGGSLRASSLGVRFGQHHLQDCPGARKSSGRDPPRHLPVATNPEATRAGLGSCTPTVPSRSTAV